MMPASLRVKDIRRQHPLVDGCVLPHHTHSTALHSLIQNTTPLPRAKMNIKSLLLPLALLAIRTHALALTSRNANPLLLPRQVCTTPAPAKGSLITVNLILFSDAGCCNQVATDSEAFELEAQGGFCNNVSGGFQSLRQAVGQDVFGRNIRIFGFSGEDCTGSSGVVDLSNAAVCDTFGGVMRSYVLQT